MEHKRRLMFACAVACAANIGLRAALPKPVAHYSFDEPAGDVAKDVSGNGLDAKLVNCEREKVGLRGRAVRLDGKRAYVSLPRDPRIDRGGDFTYSIWFKGEPGKRGLALFSRGGYSRGFSSYVFRSFAAFSSTPAGSKVVYRHVPMGAGLLDAWNNFTVVVASGGEGGAPSLRMYLNGKRLVEKGVDKFPLKGPVPTAATLTIGQYTSNESQWFAGLLDEAKVFDRALDDAEVAEEYKTGLTRVPVGEVEATKTQAVAFPPLKRRRVAVFDPPKEKWMQKPEPSAEWYAETARALGCKADVIDDVALCDEARMSVANYDTLVLPVAAMPVQAEVVLWKFLEAGGNMVVETVMPAVYKRLADGTYDEIRGQKLFTHARGWFAPFLVRRNPSPAGSRKMVDPLALAPETK